MKKIKEAFQKSKAFITDAAKKGTKSIIIVALATTIAYQNFFPYNFLWFKSIPGLKNQVEKLKTEIELEKEKTQICTNGNAILSSAIDKQNLYIEKMQDKSIEMQTKFNETNLILLKQRSENQRTITNILNRPTPKTCDEAIQHLLNSRETLKWVD